MIRSFVTALGLSLATIAQQPNSGGATMTIGGAGGPAYPIATTVRTNTNAAFALSGAPGAPFAVAVSATGLVQAGTFVSGGGIVDIPLAPAPAFAFQSALDSAGLSAFSVAVPAPGVPPTGIPLGHHEALQAVIADPTSPAGWRLTAATQITVVQGPIVVNLNLGSDGAALIDLTPHGFSIPFYGVAWSQLWICENGFLTLGSPDTDFTPTALEFNAGYPRIAPFWVDLEQSFPGSTVRYTIDPNPPAGQAPSLKADWIGVNSWGTALIYNFSASVDATGFCQLSYSTVNSMSIYTTLAGIGPGSNLNPQTAKDLSVLRAATYSGAVNESFFELFIGPQIWGGAWPNPVDLFGLTLNFLPIGAGPLPGSTTRYVLY